MKIYTSNDNSNVINSNKNWIPEEFRKYYRQGTAEAVEELCGYPAESVAEDVEGYDMKCVGYAIAKPQYAEALSDYGMIDVVEILVEAGDFDDPFLGYVVGDRIYDVSLSEIKRAVGEE